MRNLRTFTNYTPHQNQYKYHTSTAKERIIVSSIRAGKTFGLLHEIIKDAWNIEPDEPFPLPVIIASAPTYSQVKDLLYDPIKQISTACGLFKRASSMLSNMQIELLNGRIIVFRTLGANAAETVRGLTAKSAYIDEAALCSLNAINVVRGRLITTNGRLTLATTPKGKANWLYQEYFSSTAQIPDDTEIFHYSIYDNPVITAAAVEHLRNTYSPKLFEQEVEGKFVSLDTSSIYYEFDYDRNVSSSAVFSPNFHTWIGVDYNLDRNPAIFAYKRTDGVVVVFDELYGCKSTKELANAIRIRYKVNPTIVDDAKSGTARSQVDGSTNRQILNQLGLTKIISSRVNPPRTERYDNVNAHFRNAKGNTRIIINPKCKHLIKDLMELEFKPNSDKPETINEQLGHASDALGYLLAYISPWAGREGQHPRTQNIIIG